MLTTKKRGYADAIMRGENQTQSAISAGYSAFSAKYKGHQLSKDRDVLAYIKRMKPQSEEKAPDITADAAPKPAKKSVKAPEKSPEVAEEVATAPPSLIKPEAIDDPLVVMRRIMNDNLLLIRNFLSMLLRNWHPMWQRKWLRRVKSRRRTRQRRKRRTLLPQ